MCKLKYAQFEEILEKSLAAYQYACENFDALMERQVCHVLYGPPSFGPGALCLSRRLIRNKDRVLRPKTRRVSYHAYYFDCDWKLLYTRHYVKGRLDCSLLNFEMENVDYGCFFFGDTNKFYDSLVFCTQFTKGKPVLFSMADTSRIYIEYYREIYSQDGKRMLQCDWYDYYPRREITQDGLAVSKDAEFGAPNSPVSLGSEIFELFHWPPAIP